MLFLVFTVVVIRTVVRNKPTTKLGYKFVHIYGELSLKECNCFWLSI